ncbi:MAG: long-chain fatty acid--CoA ligase [Actinobacteria bacterium]|nr:MAG: long-chain fatty acid--CoA ligase [Actinomycetota bacterium]
MRNQGIGSWPARRRRKSPERVAIVHEGRELTYRQLDRRVLRLASALRELGVGKGDRVAYLGPNHPAFLETLFAAGVLGAVFVPLNLRLAVGELAYMLADCGASVLVDGAEPGGATAELQNGRTPRHVITLAGPHGAALGYEQLIETGSEDAIDEPVGLDDMCVIMYTSGTTGRPKGATLTHGNVTWNSVNVLVDIDLGNDEVTLVVAPLFHTAGLNMTCLPTLLKGGTVVLVSAFDPAMVLELVARHRVTYMFGVPAMYDAIAATPGWADADLSSLRQVNCGGAPVPEQTIRTYQERGLVFSQGYGMTEASPGALYLGADMSAAKVGSAGVPHFFTDVRVVDGDLDKVRPGEKGEVVVSGPNVMTGYWRQPDETARALLPGGWFRSGDVATVDEEGYVSIVDRIKDMIISGGENVYPAEVEAVLYEHPRVAECAVIAVPDPRWGEVGRALVVRASDAPADEQDILGFLDGRLARYKVPKSVVFVDEIPRTASGKVLKRPLRDRYGAP